MTTVELLTMDRATTIVGCRCRTMTAADRRRRAMMTAVSHCATTTANHQLLASVERYDPARDTWEAMPPMRHPRSEFAAAVVEWTP